MRNGRPVPEAASRIVLKPRPAPEPVLDNATPGDLAKQRKVQQKQMNERFEAAACRAPGTADRVKTLSEAEREKFRARCAAVGVKVP